MGIPISVDASWLVIFALIVFSLAQSVFPRINPQLSSSTYWVAGVIAGLLLFVSVLLHELAHSYVAKANGMDVGGITLFIFGGVSRLKDEPKTPEIELKMALAGPITSLVLGGVLYVIAKYGGRALLGDLGVLIVGYLAIINVILGIFNLVPGFPLDGGRVLRAILWGSLNSLERATKIASGIGQGFGYLLMVGGFLFMLRGEFLNGLWLVFIGWFLNNAAQQGYQQLALRRALSGVKVGRVMTSNFPHVPPDTTLDQFVHDYLLAYDYTAYPVTEDDNLLGMVSSAEVREVSRLSWHNVTVREVAKPPVEEYTIDEDKDAFDALMHMAEGKSTRLLVMHDGKLKGMVTQDSIIDIVRAKLGIGV